MRGIVSAERLLQQPSRQSRPRPERLVLLAKTVECRRRGPKRAIEVVDNRPDPRHGELRRSLEGGIPNPPLAAVWLPGCGERPLVVTDFDCGHGPDERQLRSRAVVQLVGSQPQLPRSGPPFPPAVAPPPRTP